MYSVMMTGYMFRNAQYRLELQQSIEQIALPDPEKKVFLYSFKKRSMPLHMRFLDLNTLHVDMR